MPPTATLTNTLTPTESSIIKDSHDVSSTEADKELIDELVEFLTDFPTRAELVPSSQPNVSTT
eukprot:11693116-Ditylum_brightwellii.AAC.1